MKIIKGYKAFDKNLTCRGMQYEIGKTYEMENEPILCERGFHFCKSLADCYNFYSMSEETRICKVKAIGDIVTSDNVKFCTNKITIIKEVKNPGAKSNLSDSSAGYFNSGNRNNGNQNSGNCNTGYCNSGNRNRGDCNSGNRNNGDFNSGNRNSGDFNTGYCNSGDCNTGNRNSGNRNSGDFNSGNQNSGVFCTSRNPTIKFFDKESDWTMDDWINSDARYIMSCCPYTYSDFIYECDMTDEEKEKHPEHKTIGGYIKTFIATTEDKQKWWDELSEEEKKAVMSLPNFDADKFKECTGIEVEKVRNK